MHMAVDTIESGEHRRTIETRPRFSFATWTELPPLPRETGAAEGAGLPKVDLWERVLAFIMLVLLAPALTLVALVIKLDSPGGPVLFRQERVGLDRRRRVLASTAAGGADRRQARGIGRPFGIYKFRTMIPDAERHTGAVWATERDPRITRVGRVLRHLRIDEIPQLINILHGEMRLVGPRPERPQFVHTLMEQIPEYAARQKVPPGITGLAQVKRHYDATVQDVCTKVKYDVYYVNNRSWLLDLKIMIKTIDVMLLGRGAR
jgi:lipopolysaccharide/colanic/teichoic acid biosynthesis glycosyltransferase